jgi:hypothetical protein
VFIVSMNQDSLTIEVTAFDLGDRMSISGTNSDVRLAHHAQTTLHHLTTSPMSSGSSFPGVK